MQTQASISLRVIYCLAILGAVFPFPISGWVTMTLGGNGTVPFIGPILFLLLGVYRIISVVRNGNILNSQKPTGLILSIRMLGIIAMTLGAAVAIAYPFINSIALAIFGKPGDSGVAFYVVGLYFAMAKGLAPLGVVFFEASRLMGFEEESTV